MKSALLFAVFMFLIVSACALIIGIGYECCRRPGQTPPSIPWIDTFAQEWSIRPARPIVLPGHDLADLLTICGIVFLDLERPESYLAPGSVWINTAGPTSNWPITSANWIYPTSDPTAPPYDEPR